MDASGLTKRLLEPAQDLRYLLSRGYPQEESLRLVGNRHRLEAGMRRLLHRGVFAEDLAKSRRLKIIASGELTGQDVAIDGHNQVITLQSALKNLPLVEADDGLIRDTALAGPRFSLDARAQEALEMLAERLAGVHPSSVLILFDSPISRSGELASLARERFAARGLQVDSKAVPVPEKELIHHPGVVATSDGAIIDRCQRVVDLAGEIIRERFGSAW